MSASSINNINSLKKPELRTICCGSGGNTEIKHTHGLCIGLTFTWTVIRSLFDWFVFINFSCIRIHFNRIFNFVLIVEVLLLALSSKKICISSHQNAGKLEWHRFYWIKCSDPPGCVIDANEWFTLVHLNIPKVHIFIGSMAFFPIEIHSKRRILAIWILY